MRASCSTRSLLVFLFLGIFVGLCMAQSGPDTPPPALFRSRADLVALDVTVQDQSGRSVSELARDDFTVLEENVPRTSSSFRRADACRLPSPFWSITARA
jgi:hypothetical protein